MMPRIRREHDEADPADAQSGTPFAASRMLRDLLRGEGVATGRELVATLTRRMGIEALYRLGSRSLGTRVGFGLKDQVLAGGGFEACI